MSHTQRPIKRWGRILLAPVLLVVSFGVSAAQDTAWTFPDDDAVAALSVELGIERVLLLGNMKSYDQVSVRRNQAMTRLAELYRRLERLVQSQNSDSLGQGETVLRDLERAQGDKNSIEISERILVDKILERRLRITMLEQQLAALEGREQKPTGELDGTWDVVLLPLEQSGTFTLQQSGTLIRGTYRLAGGLNGSLEGTLVNRRVQLERIDSRLGRMMKLEGTLSSSSGKITGTWLNFELAGGDGASGQWVATKQEREN